MSETSRNRSTAVVFLILGLVMLAGGFVVSRLLILMVPLGVVLALIGVALAVGGRRGEP